MAQITFTIPNDKIEIAMECFVAAEPIPTNLGGKPKYTPAQWFRAWVILKTKQAIQKGKNKLDATKIDDNIIQ